MIFSMPEKNYKNPADFDIPETYRAITPGELWKASADPALRAKIRFFSEQVEDVMSAYMKGEETPEEVAFLKQCREDSKAFRKALEGKIRAVADGLDEDSVEAFVFEQLRCSNTRSKKAGFTFSVEIRPLFFTSLMEDEQKERSRYASENRYTVFFHIDQHHRFQMTRFVVPNATHHTGYQLVMESVLSVLASTPYIGQALCKIA